MQRPHLGSLGSRDGPPEQPGNFEVGEARVLSNPISTNMHRTGAHGIGCRGSGTCRPAVLCLRAQPVGCGSVLHASLGWLSA
jgi:hypothetical protein